MLASVIGLVACGSSPPVTAPSTTPGRAPIEPLGVRLEVGQGHVLEPLDVGAAPEGGRAVLVGGARVILDGARSRAAADTLMAWMVGATRTPDGWRFLDEHATMWSAESFLGPLARVGRVDDVTTRLSPAPSHGVLVAFSRRGDCVRVGDGVGPWREIRRDDVVAASFLDAAHGLVLVEGGFVLRTADGGRTWSPVDLGPDFDPRDARSLHPSEDGAGWRVGRTTRVDRDGSAHATERAERGRAEVPFHVRTAMLGMLAADVPAPFVDGVLLMSDRSRITRVSPFDGAMEPLPEGTADGCTLGRWGPYAAAICPQEGSEDCRLLRSEDGRTFHRARDSLVSCHPVLGDDGRGLVWTTGESLVVDAGLSDAPPVTVPRPESSYLAALRGSLVVSYGTNPPSLFVIDVSQPSPTPAVVAIPGGLSLQSVSLERDGSLVVAATRSEAEPGVRSAVLLRGPTRGPLAVVPTPPGARVAALSGVHGLAVGDNLATTWTTRDGGVSWAPLAVRVLGDPTALPWNASRHGRVQLWCGPERCAARSLPDRFALTVWNEAPPSAAPTRLVVADAELPFAPAAARWPRLECARDGPPQDVAAPRARRAQAQVELVGGHGRGRLSLGAGDRVQLAWWGHDDEGAFAIASAPTTMTGSELPAVLVRAATARGGAVEMVPWRALVLTREVVVLERHRGGHHLVHAVARGPVVETDATAWFSHVAMRLPDGTFAGIGATQRYAWVAGHGRAPTTRRAALFESARDGVTVIRGEPAYVVLGPSTTHAYGIASLRVLDSLGVGHPTSACRGPAPPDALLVRTSSCVEIADPDDDRMGCYVEIHAGTSCIRSIETTRTVSEPSETIVAEHLFARPDGRMVGWVSGPAGRIPTSCTLAPR